jgi:hypothetical protein
MRSVPMPSRSALGPIDLLVEGVTPGDDLAAAGGISRPVATTETWRIESPWATPNEVLDLRRRIAGGPPRVD